MCNLLRISSPHLTDILDSVSVRGAAQHHQRGGDVGVAQGQAGEQGQTQSQSKVYHELTSDKCWDRRPGPGSSGLAPRCAPHRG